MALGLGLSSLQAAPPGPRVVTAQQRAAAEQTAQAGVPLRDLRPDAPPRYTVQPRDTLWGIAQLYLQSPWRWPELWGMNLAQIRNPHLIYPGQTLVLDTGSGQAVLKVDPAPAEPPLVKLSPQVRSQGLTPQPLTTLQGHLIEPFLSEPVVVEERTLESAPRIVATQDGRVLISRGDRAYVRSSDGEDLLDDPTRKQRAFRVFRDATPLKDPITGEILGFEAQYLGRALLARSEGLVDSVDRNGQTRTDRVPATIDIVQTKQEMRLGDRLLPEPPRTLQSYVPHAPLDPVDARIVSVYGTAVVNAAQNQVVAINRGEQDGIEVGHVLAILKDGARLIDKTDPSLPEIKLPDERNGLLMVFRTFEKVSYALVLNITTGVRVGDRLVNP
ncbi:MAG: LysM peptidoglycan-binding domain-containing protein [Rhodoferax sp.]